MVSLSFVRACAREDVEVEFADHFVELVGNVIGLVDKRLGTLHDFVQARRRYALNQVAILQEGRVVVAFRIWGGFDDHEFVSQQAGAPDEIGGILANAHVLVDLHGHFDFFLGRDVLRIACDLADDSAG